MWLFLAVLMFWGVVLTGGKSLFKTWRQRRILQPARSLKDIASVAYYSQLPQIQFESLVIQGMRARGFTFLGDPWLGRAKDQGYAWRKGRKVILSYRLTRLLTPDQLEGIAKKLHLARAETVLVFSPFSEYPKSAPNGVEVLAGKKLLCWFSILDTVAPPIASKSPAERCECGALMKDRVSRAGLPLLVCSMFPDCRVVRRPVESSPETTRIAATGQALPA